jgi:hypothetical protein
MVEALPSNRKHDRTTDSEADGKRRWPRSQKAGQKEKAQKVYPKKSQKVSTKKSQKVSPEKSDLERKTAELILSRKLGGANKTPPKLQHRTQSVPNLLAADKAPYFLLVSVSTILLHVVVYLPTGHKTIIIEVYFLSWNVTQ